MACCGCEELPIFGSKGDCDPPTPPHPPVASLFPANSMPTVCGRTCMFWLSLKPCRLPVGGGHHVCMRVFGVFKCLLYMLAAVLLASKGVLSSTLWLMQH